MNRNRLIAAGLLLGLGYLAVAWLSISLGWIATRPLYDGLVPLPPYKWVEPPAERVTDNEVPGVERFAVKLNADGSADPGSVTTGDGQATVTFDLITPLEGESFDVTITPASAQTLTAAPADGYFDGNAYRVEAFYTGTQTPVKGSMTVVLRFSVHARQILALKGGAWDGLFRPIATRVDQQVRARTSGLGTFVAAGQGIRPATGQDHSDSPEAAEQRPYRWVNPPAGRGGDNEIPEPEKVTARVDSFGQTDVDSVVSSDDQFAISFDYLPPQEGIVALEVALTPVDAGALAAPPTDLRFEGNAYRVEAVFADGTPPETIFSTISLRYLEGAEQVLLLGASGWEPLPDAAIVERQRRIEAKSDALGTFVVAAARPSSDASSTGSAQRTAVFALFSGAVLLGVLALLRRRGQPKPVVGPVETQEPTLD